MRFAAPSPAEASRIAHAMRAPELTQVPGDHMAAAEHFIAAHSHKRAEADMQELVSVATFEGMLLHHGT